MNNNRTKRLHFLIDSPFYTSRIIDKVNRLASDKHEFIVVHKYDDLTWHIKDEKRKYNFKEAIGALKKGSYDFSYVHFLSTSISYLILKAGLEKSKIAWIMWGADFYRLPKVRDQYFMPLSKPFAPQPKVVYDGLVKFLGMPGYDLVEKVLDHVDFYAWYIEEYELVMKEVNHPIQYVDFEYYFAIDELPKVNSTNKSNKILLGNSDDPTNNHLDTIEHIGKNIKKKVELVIPVSGASAEYIKSIKQKLEDYNIDAHLITESLDVETFYSQISDVGIVIYGHLRQQGGGTLFPLIASGKKIFMWKDNPFFSTLTRWGVKIHELENITDSAVVPEEPSVAQRNRTVLEDVMSVEKNEERWENLLSLK